MEEESSQAEVENPITLKDLLISNQAEAGFQPNEDDSKPKESEKKACLSSLSPTLEDPSNSDVRLSPSRCSPEPSCSICLGQLQNKSFTDSCFHTFCFSCLVEWSKVKAECPLCKQRFKSIVHNVRSIEDYDQYYITSRNSDGSWQNSDGRRFRYNSTLTAERLLERRRRIAFEDSVEYRTHRLRYAPHSVTSFPVPRVTPEYPTSSGFRRRIYEVGLWIKPVTAGARVRFTSPDFFRQNPACTHRLIPWLNRELLALLHNSESQVMFVLDLILALIMRYDIRSQEFYVHIQPYLADRTSHFVHEFYNYASSPHDMTNYDTSAMYEPLETLDNSIVLSSPGSDVVALPSSDERLVIEVPSATAETSRNIPKTKAIRKKRPKQGITKLFLKRNQENNLWQTVWASSPCSSSSFDSPDIGISPNLQRFLDTGVMPGPSTSGLYRGNYQSATDLTSIPSTANIQAEFSDEEDCMVVSVVKPKSQRTPEIVDLITSSDDEAVTAIETVHTENNINDVVLPTVELQFGETSKKQSAEDGNSNSSSQNQEKDKKRSKDCSRHCRSRKRSKPQKYSSKCADKRSKKSKHSKRRSNEKLSDAQSHSSDQDDHDRWSLSSSQSRSRDFKSPSFSPPSKSRQKSHSYSSKYFDSESTETYESDFTEEDTHFIEKHSLTKVRKVKLRSVVAQPSVDHQYSRSDSSYHSSHCKKHKDKHKKKKKHDKYRRHKRHSNSGESG